MCFESRKQDKSKEENSDRNERKEWRWGERKRRIWDRQRRKGVRLQDCKRYTHFAAVPVSTQHPSQTEESSAEHCHVPVCAERNLWPDLENLITACLSFSKKRYVRRSWLIQSYLRMEYESNGLQRKDKAMCPLSPGQTVPPCQAKSKSCGTSCFNHAEDSPWPECEPAVDVDHREWASTEGQASLCNWSILLGNHWCSSICIKVKLIQSVVKCCAPRAREHSPYAPLCFCKLRFLVSLVCGY